ncbi:ubiquinone biosynthesis o-methyltransferase, partial [Quercus suber]
MNRWDSKGPFKPLHVMNPTRLAFIRIRPAAIPTQNSLLVICYGRLFSNASSSSSTGGFQRASSLKDLELAKFTSIAETWAILAIACDESYKTYFHSNSTRCYSYPKLIPCCGILKGHLSHCIKDPNSARPFEGLKIVDVGCAGGILSE